VAQQEGGRRLLLRYPSVPEMVKDLFPELKWQDTQRKLVLRTTPEILNQHRLLLNSIGKELGVRQVKD